MMKYAYSLFVLLATALAFAPTESFAQNVSIWSCNVHDKLFIDTEPGDVRTLTLSAASNEYESAQFGIRCDQDLNDLSITSSSLVCALNGETIDAQNIRVRRIGLIPITKNTPDAAGIAVRQAPFNVPEVLYDENVVTLKANETLGVWVTAFIPKGTSAGQYSGKLILKSESYQGELPIELTVYPFELPDARSLYMTNWWSHWNVATYHKVPYQSEKYWELIEAYIKNMGDHRQNVLLVPWIPSPSGFITDVRKEDGSWEFDFSRFERLLQIAEKHGVADRIELSHIGGIDRTNHVVTYNITNVFDEKTQETINVSIDEWLEPSLKALCDYLKKTNRLDRAMIHVADEPYLPDIESWRAASQRVRSIAPELKQIDAIETVNFSERLDVWVPKLTHFDRWREAFEERRGDGEFWYYVCCHPIGPYYPNRFMDLPGARIRVLHWINYSEDLVGYLHWGYNHWRDDAFGAPTEMFGPGDTHLVYPGPNGPLDSIRWELERESAEDYEYLKLLENSVAKIKSQLDPEKAWAFAPKSRSKEIARKIAPDLTNTTLDGSKIEQARQELANEIAAATGELKLIVQTFPENGKIIFSGPNLVELYGITTPSATVTVNDEIVPVDEDGCFKRLFYADAKGEMPVVVTATLGDKTVKTVRNFTIK